MKAFAELFERLDRTTKTSAKLAALREYFASADPADAAWAVAVLSGRRVKRLVPARKLAEWACDQAGIPGWLFEECYEAVGDLAETVSLLLPPPVRENELPLHGWIERRLLPLKGLDEARQRAALAQAWSELGGAERFLWNKLLTGSFRVGVSQRLVVRAVAESAGLDPAVAAHRLMGNWSPSAGFFERLIAPESDDADAGRPYPFFLAHQLDDSPDQKLGERADWLAEWKWDGIRAQLIRRRGETFVWSRGEELMTERFPELLVDATRLPDGTVLDGEILAWKDSVLPFAVLQRRIGRKTLGRKILADAPVVFLAFDLLEAGGGDLRAEPLRERRRRLETLMAAQRPGSALRLAEPLPAPDWAALAEARRGSRELGVEGLMLKRLDSAYGVGRETGPWWKWKIEPYTIDCVLIYAQQGHGRRAGLYTDYTFGVWKDGELTPFAKAYSGLSDEEIRQVDRFVRRNTLERFGPVRAVEPELVFELAFENIQRSTRHKSGVAVRFPRMNRWRKDKKPQDADTLDDVLAMIPPGP
ncbi:MAG: ATP-dependent DNA ligase [Acidobacteria bacterium]|nr:ATP-dependent DNA ligase [Acidobacteriota bacterium]